MVKRILLVMICFFFLSSSHAIAQEFSDVTDNFWAEEEVLFLYEEGIINGYSDGSFGVNDDVTRGQAASILARALNLEFDYTIDHSFEDVKEGDPHYEEIMAVVEEDIFNEASTFSPNDPLTRAQMAKVLAIAFELEGNYPMHFRDIQEDYWAEDYVQSLLTEHITTGYENFTYKPSNNTTRAQLSVFLSRLIDESFLPERSFEPNTYYTYTFRETDYEEDTVLEHTRSIDYEYYQQFRYDKSDVWKSTHEDYNRLTYVTQEKGMMIGIPQSDSLKWGYQTPLKQGNEWEEYFEGLEEPSGTSTITGISESVTTEAGTFIRALEVTYETYDGSLRMIFYLVPQLGEVKSQTFENTNGEWTEIFEKELIDISPDERTYSLDNE